MSRRVVVTGSASGIGQATAALLRERGDTVLGIDRADADVCVDLSTDSGREAAATEVLEKSDGIVDAVVASAGVFGGGPRVPSVNFFGVTRLLAVLRLSLSNSDAPRVVVLGSLAGVYPPDVRLVDACLADEEAAARTRAGELPSDSLVYGSCKAALVRWVGRTAVGPDWAGHGIALNAVCPGVVVTPMTRGMLDDPNRVAEIARDVPMPLNGHASATDVAHAIGWLVSAENTHITGQAIFVDGGAEAVLRGQSHA